MNKIILIILFFPFLTFSKNQKSVPCDEKTSQQVRIAYGRVTTLNFPTAPHDAIPGDGGFDIKRIQQDLVIKAMKPGASTNLIVYLENRRCFFKLTTGTNGDESIFVRDLNEDLFEAKFVK